MSLFSIRIRNYRNVRYDNPIEIGINKDITFIVGVNNIGKTNLLRIFYELRPLFSSRTEEHFRAQSLQVQVTMPQLFSDDIINQSSYPSPLELEFFKPGYSLLIRLTPMNGAAHTNNFLSTFVRDCKISAKEESEILQCVLELFQKATLIPTLRIASNQGSGQARDIAVGPDLLNQFANWSTGPVVSQRRQIESLFDELRELFGYKRFELAISNDRTHLIVKNDDGSFRLEELGEGLGHFIVVLMNALFKAPGFVLIDEPEIGLHPKMQELFVRTLASKARMGLIAVSHSIGLARSAGDTIYSLSRDKQQKLHLLPFGEHHPATISQSISEMGYSQFVELGGNHFLLVEGRTDIKSFREILRKYGIENNFIIWQLGGSAFIGSSPDKIVEELNEIKRLNAKSYWIIFDSERTASGQPLKAEFQSFKETCESMGFTVFATDYHSTENYIKQDAINSIAGPGFSALSPYEKFGSVNRKWEKNKNWLMFRSMKVEDFGNTELDAFIRQRLVPISEKP